MKITIEHNHGFITLDNAKLMPYEYTNSRGDVFQNNDVCGTVVAGRSTDRLFQATSTKFETIGEFKTVNIWGRKPYQKGDGTWFVSICTCG